MKQLRYHLAKAWDQITQYANKKSRAVTIKEGDWVFLKIRPHRQASMPTRLHPKLSAHYNGRGATRRITSGKVTLLAIKSA